MPSRSSSQVERLTAQFYDWERRGRGWDVCSDPVEPEPPFAPFEFHWAPPADLVYDDGRRPTLLSKIGDRLRNLGGPREPSELIDFTFPEVDPEWCEHDEPVVEFRMTVPQTVKISRDATVQFLASLPRTAHPLAFEVVGRADRITFQLVCLPEDAGRVRQQLLAYFPEAVVTPEDEPLTAIWGEGQERSALVVDFGLMHEFMRPLRTARGTEVDSLTGILGSLSTLEENEVGVLQVLFQHVQRPWVSSIVRAIHDDEGKPFFLDAPEITTLAREKIGSPLFACVLRVGVRSPSLERVWSVARAMGGALQVLTRPESNELIPLAPDLYDEDEHTADFLARRTRRTGMLLSSDELVTLVHLPGSGVRIEKLLRVVRKTRAVPPLATGNELTIGVNAHGGTSTEVSLNAEQRSQHMYVVGGSGTGKSTLLQNLILQDLERGEGLAVLDPHGELIDEIVHRIPEHRIKDVVLLDPADIDHPIGFNILSAHTDLERMLLESDLVAVFQRLSTSWGDQMTSVLSNAILAFLESDRGGTLVDLRRFLVEPSFRNEILGTVRDPNVVYYWRKEFPLLAHKPHASILTRLNTFLRPKPVRLMVAQRDARLDLGAIMSEGKVLLARLSQGAIGMENAYLLGTLLVAKFQQLALSRQELAAEDRRPFYLYMDEFQYFVTPTMQEILSGARKYRLGLILAHHNFQQLAHTPDVLTAVLTHPYTRICFRVGDQDARKLEDGFASFDRADLQVLGRGEAIARVERADWDFNLTTQLLPPTSDQSSREAVIAHSRATYARPRSEVEAIVEEALGLDREDLEATAEVRKASRRGAAGAPKEPRVTVPATPPGSRQPEPLAAMSLPESPPTGRGGKVHRYLQNLIKEWATANEWGVMIEESVLDGLGSVDVTLQKGGQSVACEIGVTTTPEHELDNIQKCLTAGFQHVAFISPETKTRSTVKRLLEDALPQEMLARVHVTSPEELLAHLEHLNALAAGGEKTIRGRKVKVRFTSLDEKEKVQRRGAVAQVIAKALRRLEERK